MRLQLIRLWFRLLALLPLRVNHALGGAVGWLAWALPTRARRITLINLGLCYPDRDPAYRQQLARRSLIETGKSLTELGPIWFKPRQSLEKLIRNVYGIEHLRAAKLDQQGLLVVSPHLGAWELSVLPLASEHLPILMYRPPRQKVLEPILIGGRTRYGAELATLTRTGIKAVLGGLREGRVVGILPDQEPDLAHGVFAPFFGVPVNTMTLLARLAVRSNAGLIFMFFERLPRGHGYNLHYIPADDAIRSPDKVKAASALNANVQACVSLIPHQYIWSYKRFRLKEDGTRRGYQDSELH